MTRIIAHRGLLEGPDLGLENTKTNIEKALSMGFDVEIDIRGVRVFPDRVNLFIGHDTIGTVYKLDELSSLMLKYPNSIFWMHCKNVPELTYLLSNYDLPSNHEIFFHDKDEATITYPLGCIWAYPKKDVKLKNQEFYIDVLPETWGPPSSFKERYEHKNWDHDYQYTLDKNWDHDYQYTLDPYAICTDYPIILKRTLDELNDV